MSRGLHEQTAFFYAQIPISLEINGKNRQKNGVSGSFSPAVQIRLCL
jgi:hypothetical protein